MSEVDVETVVIGAGVVGLAIAREMALRGHDVLVLEAHPRIGAETSSRSSEVIHAGLYYPTGSLKARLCVEGRELLYRFAAEAGVPHRRCGKLLVATQDTEIAKLDDIARAALRNGVNDLVRLTGGEVRRLEAQVEAVAGLLSPSTGIVDSHALMVALQGGLEAAGGQVVLSSRVEDLSRGENGTFALDVASGGTVSRLACRQVVIAAGHGASELADKVAAGTAYRPPRTTQAKGHYFTLTTRAPFRHLVYPIPEPGGLGIHLTLDLAGQARFGPDVTWQEGLDYAFEDEGGARQARFEREIRRYWPLLPDGALQRGYTGIRPKISREGEGAADFAIHGPAAHGMAGLVALYGIESPGLTASLAIARHVAGLIAD